MDSQRRDDLLFRLRSALIGCDNGKALCWEINYHGVNREEDEGVLVLDDEGFEAAIEKINSHHVQIGLDILKDDLQQARQLVNAAELPREMARTFGAASEACECVNVFALVTLDFLPGDVVDREFGKLVNLVEPLRPDLLRAMAAIREHGPPDTSPSGPQSDTLLAQIRPYPPAGAVDAAEQASPTGIDVKGVDLREELCPELTGQARCLFGVLRSSRHWVSFSTIAATPGAFRTSEPEDEAIIKALKRLRDRLGSTWNIEVSATHCHARLESLSQPKA